MKNIEIDLSKLESTKHIDQIEIEKTINYYQNMKQ